MKGEGGVEKWKDIRGYEGKYQVSNTGKVRTLNYKFQGFVKEVKQGVDYYGYPKIRLAKDGVRKEYKVHRLVAQAFLENDNNLPEVNHIDYDRKNNNVSNLEWVSKIGNLKHQYSKTKFFEAKKVIAIPMNGGEPLLFESVSAASRALKIPTCCFSYSENGNLPSKKGYVLKGA